LDNNLNKIRSFLCATIDTRFSVKPNVIVVGSIFNLQKDSLVVGIRVIVSDSNELSHPEVCGIKSNCSTPGTIPAELPALCRVETHQGTFVFVVAVSH
jgi:hypothetical protein